MTDYKGPVCRGSWILGTACKVCERCIETKPQMVAQVALPALGNDPDILARIAKERDEQRTRADKAEAERDALREAVRAAIVWHEEQGKAISKQPNAATGLNGWMRHQHQEQRDMLTTALGEDALTQPEPDPLMAFARDLFDEDVPDDAIRQFLNRMQASAARHGLAVKEVTRHD